MPPGVDVAGLSWDSLVPDNIKVKIGSRFLQLPNIPVFGTWEADGHAPMHAWLYMPCAGQEEHSTEALASSSIFDALLEYSKQGFHGQDKL